MSALTPTPTLPRSPRIPRKNVRYSESDPAQIRRSSESNLTNPNQQQPPLAPTPLQTPPKTLQAQKQVEEVTNILRDNVRGLVEREGKLDDLESRAKSIAESSKLFEKTIHKVKETSSKRNSKMLIAAIVISIVTLFLIGGILYYLTIVVGS